MLEELAETHFCRVVFGGMFSSLPFIEHKMQPCFQTFSHLFLGETSTIHATARTSSSSRDKNESLTLEVLRVLRDTMQKRPNLFKREETFSSAAAVTMFFARVSFDVCGIVYFGNEKKAALS